MPRVVDPDLQILIDSGHCDWMSNLDITLSDGTVLHYGTAEEIVNGFNYLAQISDISSLVMSLSGEVDEMDFKVQNVDMAMGRVFTGAVRKFDGATAKLGITFIDPDTGVKYYDEKLPGELVDSEVVQQDVSFKFLDMINAGFVSGRTVASEFPWRDPVPGVPITGDPNDIPGQGSFDREPIAPGVGGGRYPIIQPMLIL